MEDLSTIGIIILFSAFIISRIISEKALRQLSPDQKVLILDSFSKMRMYNLIPLVLIIVAYFFIKEVTSFHSYVPYIFFLAILFLFVIAIQVVSFKKLKSLKLPDVYLKKYLTSQIIVIVVFLIWIPFTIYSMI